MTGSAPGPKEQRRAQHRELSRVQILDAAEEVFARKGFHDATVKEIATAAEFSVGGVYSFFADKDDVFVQIYLRRGAEFMDGMRALLAEQRTPRETLHQLADYQVQFFREHANFGRLYLRGSGATLGELLNKTDHAVVENYTEAMNLQTKLFRDGQDAGELRDGDPEVLSLMFSGIVSSYQTADVTDERMTLAELHEILDGAFRR